MALELDEHGHLRDRSSWHKSWAIEAAKAENIVINEEHWMVIDAVRHVFEETGDTPPMRLLINLLRQRISPEINSQFLYRLFPQNPVRQASKYAGLPKPKHCM